MSSLKVLIVDDHQVIREGLRVMLSSSEVEVVGQAATGEEAVAKADALKPDIILMDLRMPGQGGVAASREIKQGWPEAKIVALTTFLEEELVSGALEAGVAAYILKDTPADELTRVLQMVHNGHTVFSPHVYTMAMHRTPEVKPPAFSRGNLTAAGNLTDREKEILQLMARGLDNHQIAQALYITIGTARNSVSRIYSKLGVDDRTQAVVWAIDKGLAKKDW